MAITEMDAGTREVIRTVREAARDAGITEAISLVHELLPAWLDSERGTLVAKLDVIEALRTLRDNPPSVS